ncbi:MAG: Holliday junction branch migration protein RuvA [Planctomycetota bacterium]
MIVRVRGKLEAVKGNAVVVGVGDGSIAREVLVSAFDSSRMHSMIGNNVELHTLEVYEASGQGGHLTPRLMGFVSGRDREFFELLCTVRGIGPRKALRVMAMASADIASAIARRDTKLLATLPEIGKRTAESIAAELHDRVSPFTIPGEQSGEPAEGSEAREALSAAVEQAIAALVQLGENRGEAERMVKRAAEQVEDHASADDLLTSAFALRS